MAYFDAQFQLSTYIVKGLFTQATLNCVASLSLVTVIIIAHVCGETINCSRSKWKHIVKVLFQNWVETYCREIRDKTKLDSYYSNFRDHVLDEKGKIKKS